MNNLSIITAADIAAFYPEISTSSYDAPTLSGIASQASQMVSDYLEYSPLAEDIVDELKPAMVTTEGDLLIYPNKIPVQSVSAIGIQKGGTTLALGLINSTNNNKYNIDFTGRNIRYPYWELALTGVPLFTNFMALRGQTFYTKISYRGGFELAALPATIKRAALLFARDILTAQYNPQGVSRVSQGAVSFGFLSGGTTGESDNVKQAKKLLGAYRRIG